MYLAVFFLFQFRAICYDFQHACALRILACLLLVLHDFNLSHTTSEADEAHYVV